MQNSAGTVLQIELYPPLFTYNVEFYSSSNVYIVEWVVSVSAVQLFLGSSLTISIVLACRGYIFDRRAFIVLFQKVWGLHLGCMFKLQFRVFLERLGLRIRFPV